MVRGLKEFGEPTRKALDHGPGSGRPQRGGHSVWHYLIRDSIVAVAAFGGACLWAISPATNFLAAFAFGVVGTIWFAVRQGTRGAIRPGVARTEVRATGRRRLTAAVSAD